MKLNLGTRGSALALWQANYVADCVRKIAPGIQVEIIRIKTRGDKILDSPLSLIGGKGLFTKEIEDALLENKVDFAVHSMKDLPTELPEGLEVAAIMEREDPRDVFISANGESLEELGSGARIGTSSLRRKAFLLNRFPHLEILSIRGNVDTRLKKIETENLDGVILAAAGIKRMGFADRITSFLEPDLVIPAIGQGALAIETRSADPETKEIIGMLNHPLTSKCVQIERSFLQRMGGGCQVPMAAHCKFSDGGFNVSAAVVHPDGNPMLRHSYTGPAVNAVIGSEIADVLLEAGAEKILRAVLAEGWEPGPATDIIFESC